MNTPLTIEQLNFYTNIRYMHGKSDMHQSDCFGIVKLVTEREYNVKIEEFIRSEQGVFTYKSIDKHYNKLIKNEWLKVEEPYTGCTVVLSNLNINGKTPANHVGIYVEDNQVLTTSLVMQYSNIVPIKDYTVLGYYEIKK